MDEKRGSGINIPVPECLFDSLWPALGLFSGGPGGGPGGGPRAGHQHGADQDNFQFCEIYSYKKLGRPIFPPSSVLLLLDPRSGMEEKMRIRDKHPGTAECLFDSLWPGLACCYRWPR